MFDAEIAAEFRRSIAATVDRADPLKARAALLEAGWLDALETDEAMAVAVVFGEQGRAVCDAAALDDVLAAHLGTGEVAVAYPALPGQHVVLPAHRHATRLLWVSDLSGDDLAVIDLPEALDVHEVGGIDPAAGLLGLQTPPAGTVSAVATSVWPAALAAGRVAVAHQMAAAARELLAMTTTYARQRSQFGVPIATFQAVKHRLADTYVAISAADAAIVAAATTASLTAAAVAKALSGRAADVAGRNCLQVFGGIGFTVEHDFHRMYRRSLVLDRLLGDRRMLERELGGRIRAGSLIGERFVNLDDVPRLHVCANGFGL